MGGTTGQPTAAGQTSTGNAPINNPSLNWPEWATGGLTKAPAPAAPAASPMAPASAANLGFPSPVTATPFSSESVPPAAGGFGAAGPPALTTGTDLPHLGVEAPEPADTAPDGAPDGTEAANLAAQLGQPRNPIYEDTQVAAYSPASGGGGVSYAPGNRSVDPKAYESFGAGLGQYVDPRINPYYAAAALQPLGAAPGTVLTPEQAATTSHMSQALYDFNMTAYGNPYGPAVQANDLDLYNQLVRQYGQSEWGVGNAGSWGGGA